MRALLVLSVVILETAVNGEIDTNTIFATSIPHVDHYGHNELRFNLRLGNHRLFAESRFPLFKVKSAHL